MPGRTRRFVAGTKRVAGRAFLVIYKFGAWMIIEGGKLVAIVVKGALTTFGRELGKGLARKVLAA